MNVGRDNILSRVRTALLVEAHRPLSPTNAAGVLAGGQP